MAPNDSKVSKIQTNFHALAEISASLNSASDELTKTVSVLDESLRKLNIGLPAWVLFRDRSNDDDLPHYSHDEIGYCKMGNGWGIAIRHVWGNCETDEFSSEGPWLFNDAPRDLRVQSVDKIPELIEALAKEAFDTTKRIQEKTSQVRELASAIQNLGKRPNPPPPPPAPPNRTQQAPPLPPNAATRKIPAPPLPLGAQDIAIGKGKEGDK